MNILRYNEPKLYDKDEPINTVQNRQTQSMLYNSDRKNLTVQHIEN